MVCVRFTECWDRLISSAKYGQMSLIQRTLRQQPKREKKLFMMFLSRETSTVKNFYTHISHLLRHFIRNRNGSRIKTRSILLLIVTNTDRIAHKLNVNQICVCVSDHAQKPFRMNHFHKLSKYANARMCFLIRSLENHFFSYLFLDQKKNDFFSVNFKNLWKIWMLTRAMCMDLEVRVLILQSILNSISFIIISGIFVVFHLRYEFVNVKLESRARSWARVGVVVLILACKLCWIKKREKKIVCVCVERQAKSAAKEKPRKAFQMNAFGHTLLR